MYLCSLSFYFLRCNPGCRANFLGVGDYDGDTSDGNPHHIFIKVCLHSSIMLGIVEKFYNKCIHVK